MRNEDEDDEDEDEEDEDEDENEDDDDPLSYQLEISSRGRLGGDQGDRTWACRKASGFPVVLLPAYSLLKQEQLQLAQPAFVAFPKMFKGQRFFLMFVHWKRTVGNIFSLKENGKTVQLP